jgi:hypothetical protein
MAWPVSSFVVEDKCVRGVKQLVMIKCMFDVCIYNGHPTKTTLDCRFNSEIVGVGNLFI